MLHRLATILFAASLTFGAVACSSSNPEPLPDLSQPDAGQDETPGEVPLSVKSSVVETPWSSLVVTGTGPAQGTLIYNSTARGEDTITLGSTGEFCLDIPLAEGANTIKFEAIDAGGNYSEAKFLDVTRAGEPPTPTADPVDEPGVSDRTAGATYYNNADGSGVGEVELTAGQWADMVNNNTADNVKFKGGWANNEAVAYELSEKMRVHKFEITAPAFDGDTCGPQAFDIYVTNAPEPEMSFDGTNWVKVAWVDTSGGEEGEKHIAKSVAEGSTYVLDSKARGIPATHVAIVGRNATCGGLGNEYGISEIRVIAEEAGGNVDDTVDCQGAPSCACGN
jgi:hypothetical protein